MSRQRTFEVTITATVQTDGSEPKIEEFYLEMKHLLDYDVLDETVEVTEVD